MSYIFTVSPDFSPDHISGWYIFNTWLQKHTDLAIHLEMYNNFHSQRSAIQNDSIDLIYANPYDAAILVRDKGFRPLTKPRGCCDEVIVATSINSPVQDIANLQPGIKVATTEDPDVNMIGMIMLESADLNAANIELKTSDSYVLVAKHLLRDDSDVGFFLAEAFDDLSTLIKNQLRILVRSQISVIHHSLMLGPKLADQHDLISRLLLDMDADEKNREVLSSLGFTGWDKVEDEEMEFMIDLMDTLKV
ncbi:phosphate/phosphite/phosphonate ABC transporter substrate-binding protein [Candidatus Methylobacter oryzae]|uniref:Phosphate/phosphite/phosphonate ABC transporter substrate-binding protein n=1 Tax=Candidatus Methylobacter oryzae TaxID=2497749 RepID=A0ABY3C4J4_9GAMM|nr:phosphate/phosphite/phosphonate ABC transporter substrate-binding protein [Candidatus Methylobacter oryzae]TRW89588.1 phosphate/phosphite/phosphonate ABC transporter substrate-binding protein [Candidatus Methylobacter oryzae]